MIIGISPTEDQVFAALRTWLLGVLPSGIEIVRGQANRVPEVKSTNFVVMTPGFRRRLSTNIDAFDDCRFIGSVTGTLLTVGDLSFGTVAAGHPLFGTGVPDQTVILKNISPTTWRLNQSFTLASSVLACGATDVEGHYEWGIQLSFHGDGASGTPGDNAQIASQLFRDGVAVSAFAAALPSVAPLHADEPKQIPFMNGENQWENQWIVEAHLQVNTTVVIPQEYTDSAVIGLIDVDAFYPATD